MSISVIPKFLQKAFAATGAKTDIPLNADLINGRAGYNEGFPPINMTAVAAGGIPPYGQDLNGVLYDLSTAIQYIQSGIAFPFDSAFATAIGGYAVGAIVSDASDKSLLWVNGTVSNTAFPTGWTSFAIKDPTETVRGMPLVATQAETNAGTNDAKVVTPKKLRAGFAISLGTNGYLALPTWLGGFMIQWGRFSYGDWTPSAVASSNTVTFPIAFPNAARVCLSGSTGGTANFSITNEDLSNTYVRFRYYNNQISITGLSWYWFAIGN